MIWLDQFEHILNMLYAAYIRQCNLQCVFDRCAVWICLLLLARPETESCLFCGFGLGPLGTILPGPVTHGRTIQGYRGNSWDTYGIPMGYLWDTYGIPMGYLWDTFDDLRFQLLVWLQQLAQALAPASRGHQEGDCSHCNWWHIDEILMTYWWPIDIIWYILMTYWWHVDHINPRSQRPLNVARHNGAPKPIR